MSCSASARHVPRFLAYTERTLSEAPAETLAILARELPPYALGIVLRDRDAEAGSRERWGRELRELCRQTRQSLLVSDSLELYQELEAEGFHLPTGSPLPSQVRAQLQPGAILVRAGHDRGQLDAQELSLLDGIILSPVYAVRKGRPSLGLEQFVEEAQRLQARGVGRVYALGGCEAAQLGPQLRRAPASGFALMGAAHDLPRALALAAAYRAASVSSEAPGSRA